MNGGANEAEKDTRERIARAERALTAEIVVATLRHELRNRLAAIRQASYYVSAKVKKSALADEDPRLARFLKLIDNEADAASAKLGDDEQLSKLHRREPGPSDIVHSVACAVDAARSRIVREPLVRVEEQMIHGDPDELALAVRCLLDNAIDASPPGAPITIEGRVVDGRYTLTVEDLGPGIAADLRRQATEPFFTTKPGRAGLGLPIAFRIATRQGGTLGFPRSDRGFRVSLGLAIA